jgi:methylated-DNA-[protein]-cysteine S-methyltransferase
MTTAAKKARWAALAEGDHWWPARTPVGELVLAGDDEALHWVLLPGDPQGAMARQRPEKRGRPKSVALAEQQLEAYFAGTLAHFDLPLCARGSDWQKRVWRALQAIPFGETRSYGAVASAVGNPRAARAVGGAVNANPLPVIIPCHRVVGSGGDLVGFGGGLDLKAALLAHERNVLAKPSG